MFRYLLSAILCLTLYSPLLAHDRVQFRVGPLGRVRAVEHFHGGYANFRGFYAPAFRSYSAPLLLAPVASYGYGVAPLSSCATSYNYGYSAPYGYAAPPAAYSQPDPALNARLQSIESRLDQIIQAMQARQ